MFRIFSHLDLTSLERFVTFYSDKRKENDRIKGPYDQATRISKIRILRYNARDV